MIISCTRVRSGSNDQTRSRSRNPKRRSGAAVIEMALVLPMLLLLSLGIIEFGSVFFLRSNMLFAASEAARSYAIGDVDSNGAYQMTQDRLANFNVNFQITVSPDNSADRDCWIEVTVPMSEASVGDPLRIFTPGRQLRARVHMRREN